MTTNTTYKKRKTSRAVLSIILIFLGVSCIAASITAQVLINRAEAFEKEQKAYVESLAKTGKKVDIATALRRSTVKQVKKEKMIPSYSVEQLYKMDMRKPSGLNAGDLKLVTSAGLVGLEDAFVEAERKYGVNCIFLMSIASHESAKGTIMFRPNNMFGYGRSGYSSKAENIQVVARGLSTSYLGSGRHTIRSVNQKYAATPTWTPRVAAYMAGYYATISANRAEALKNLEE